MCQVNNTRVRLSEPIKVYKVVKSQQFSDGVHYHTPYQLIELEIGKQYRAKISNAHINLWCDETQFYDGCEKRKELEDGFFHCFASLEAAKACAICLKITRVLASLDYSVLECEVPANAIVFKGEWALSGKCYESIAVSELKIIGPTT